MRAQPPAVVQLHPGPRASSVAVRTAVVANQQRTFSGGSVVDVFSDDDVVAQRNGPALAAWHAPRVALVIGLCGYSAALETQFLELNVPLTFDIDPGAPEAAKVANEVRASGDAVLIHVDRAPSLAELAAIRTRIGDFAGVASRDAAPLAKTLAGTGLIAFDERGTADVTPFSAYNVALVRRDVIADDREEAGYVGFMLGRAMERSLHAGDVVVLVRPLPTTLAAIHAFTSEHNVQFASIR